MTPGADGRPPGRVAPGPLLIALAAALVACLVLALVSGSVHLSLARLWEAVAMGPARPGGAAAGARSGAADWAIVWQLRLPRALVAALVGLALGASGALLQGLFRNPMADPYVTGVSSGGALGATLVLALGWFGRAGGASAIAAGGGGTGAFTSVSLGLPAAAFLGGLGALAAVYLLARVDGEVPVVYLLLAGVVVSAFVASLVALVIYFHPDRLQPVYFWLLGDFAGATWAQLLALAPYVAVGLGLALVLARPLNLFLFGEEVAGELGLEVEREKIRVLVVAALLSAAAVAVSGIIGFVGLVAPHVVRILAGPDHRIVVPGAALLGAAFLVLADTIARTIVAPLELPVGVVTSLVGGPFFLYLLRSHKATGYRGEAP